MPVFFLIASKPLIERMPYSYDNLIENTLRLTTKKDLRHTINYLADLPYFTPEKSSREKYINLFTEKAFLNRTCEEIGISPFDCSCLDVEEITDIDTSSEFYELILNVIEAGLYKMNSVVHLISSGYYHICKKLTFNKILNIYGTMINNKVESLRIKFSINEDHNAIFEVFSFIGSDNESPVLIPGRSKGPVTTYVYRNHKVRIKIVGVIRIDTYSKFCDNLARSLKIKPEYCICDKKMLDFYD